jgi:hypothetical protein
MSNAVIEVTMNIPRAAKELGMSSIWTRFLAIRLQIPIGESLEIERRMTLLLTQVSQ